MAAPNLKYVSGNSASTTLSAGISDSDTAVPLTSDTNFSAKAGAGMIIMGEGTSTEEFAYATGKSGASLTIPLANRGLEGGSAQAQVAGNTVKGIMTAGMWNDLIDHIVTEHNDDGTHGIVHPTVIKQNLVSNTDGETITFDMDAANIHTVIIKDNRTLAVSNVDVGQAFILNIVQDGTGGRTVTWFSTIKWVGGEKPTLSKGANSIDTFGFICTSKDNYQGYIVGQNLS